MLLIHNYIKTILLLFCMLSTTASAESIAIVVSSKAQQTLSLEQVNHIFLGRVVSLNSGQKLTPLVLPQNNPVHKSFAKIVLSKSTVQLKSYWAKQLFTGKGSVPRTVNNVADVRKLFGENTRFISYLPVEMVDDSMHVVYTFDTKN